MSMSDWRWPTDFRLLASRWFPFETAACSHREDWELMRWCIDHRLRDLHEESSSFRARALTKHGPGPRTTYGILLIDDRSRAGDLLGAASIPGSRP